MIKNKKTGQMYIGQSSNIENRFKFHCRLAPIDEAIFTEGEDNFEFKIIEEISEEELNERERYWINKYNTYRDESHYNMAIGGYGKQRYTLWDVHCCWYEKHTQKNTLKLYKSFRVIYAGKSIPIGMFHDFVSCEIINQLIEKAIEDEIK